jgi:hypothetical protein
MTSTANASAKPARLGASDLHIGAYLPALGDTPAFTAGNARRSRRRADIKMQTRQLM